MENRISFERVPLTLEDAFPGTMVKIMQGRLDKAGDTVPDFIVKAIEAGKIMPEIYSNGGYAVLCFMREFGFATIINWIAEIYPQP